MKYCLAWVWAFAGALTWSVRPASAQTASQIEKAAVDTIAELDLQIDLPGEPQTTGWEIDLPAINFSGLLLWLALAVCAGVLLYILRDYIPVLRAGRSSEWQAYSEAGADAALGGSSAQVSATADDLANQGRYVEAMHLLLLRAFAELREKLGLTFADSLTSREILRRANLPETGKASLKDIIMRVELSYFGAYPAAAPDYSACRNSYDALMALLQTQPARPRVAS